MGVRKLCVRTQKWRSTFSNQPKNCSLYCKSNLTNFRFKNLSILKTTIGVHAAWVETSHFVMDHTSKQSSNLWNFFLRTPESLLVSVDANYPQELLSVMEKHVSKFETMKRLFLLKSLKNNSQLLKLLLLILINKNITFRKLRNLSI